MQCPHCESESLKVHQRNGHACNTIYRCMDCLRCFSERRFSPYSGLKLAPEKVNQILTCLVEGNSVRSTERMTDTHRDTILRVLVMAGERCERLLEDRIKNVPVKDVQCDEVWGFCGKKEGHKWMFEKDREDIGDAYCFVAIERHSKVVLAWHLGRRDKKATEAFVEKLRTATDENRFQVTTDGFRPYVDAIDTALVDRVDFAQLVKVYATSNETEHRYSPGEVAGAIPSTITGNPDPLRICTSHVERQNLSIRMGMRRLTRLTNAFSKKWENLKAAYALWFAWYNFGRIHRTLRMTPAMQANLTDHIWDIEELLQAGKELERAA